MSGYRNILLIGQEGLKIRLFYENSESAIIAAFSYDSR